MNDWMKKHYVHILNRLRVVEGTMHVISGFVGFFFLFLPSIIPGLRAHFPDIQLIHRLFHDFTSSGPIFRQGAIIFCLFAMPYFMFTNRYLRELDSSRNFVRQWPSVTTMRTLPVPQGVFQIGYFSYWCLFGLLSGMILVWVFGIVSSVLRRGELIG